MRITDSQLAKYIQYFSARRGMATDGDVLAREANNVAIISHAVAINLRNTRRDYDVVLDALEKILALDVGDPDYKAKVLEYGRDAMNDINPELRD